MSLKTKQLIIKRSFHTLSKNGELKTDEAEKIMLKTFDQNNNKTTEISYVNEVPEQEFFYSFENDLCVEEKVNHCIDGFSEVAQNIYNSDKLITQQIRKYEYGNEITNFYYDNKKLIKREVCDEDEIIESVTNINYENDTIVLYEEYSPPSTLQLKKEVTLENGIPAQEKQWSAHNGKTMFIKYTQWQKDLEPSYTLAIEDGKVLEKTNRIYNSLNQLIEETIESNINGYQKFITTNIYDENGNLINSETKNANDIIVRQTKNLLENNLLKESTHIEVNPIDGSVQHYTDYFEYEFW